MDLSQLITVVAAVLGIFLVGLLAIVPTAMEATVRVRHHAATRRRPRP